MTAWQGDGLQYVMPAMYIVLRTERQGPLHAACCKDRMEIEAPCFSGQAAGSGEGGHEPQLGWVHTVCVGL